MPAPLRIGVAPCFMHADPTRPVFKGKTLLYAEASLTAWLMAGKALPLMLPAPTADLGVEELLEGFDGLVLQGGSDVAPASYGEEPVRAEWHGDAVRDRLERLLVRGAMAAGLPVLGICRGLQMINVALGGTLYQDLAMQKDGALVHRNWDEYDRVRHEVRLAPDGWLARLYPGRETATVNSVHHQGIKALGLGLKVEATAPDGVIEAVRFEPDDAMDPPFVYAVQWHPEFQDPADATLLPTQPIRDLFLKACSAGRRRTTGRRHGRVPPKPSTRNTKP